MKIPVEMRNTIASLLEGRKPYFIGSYWPGKSHRELLEHLPGEVASRDASLSESKSMATVVVAEKVGGTDAARRGLNLANIVAAVEKQGLLVVPELKEIEVIQNDLEHRGTFGRLALYSKTSRPAHSPR